MNTERRNFNERGMKSNEHGKTFVGIKDINDDENRYMVSGATDHLCKVRRLLKNYKELKIPKNIKIGDGGNVKTVGIGDVEMLSFSGNSWLWKRIENVCYAPKLSICKSFG